MHGPVHHGKRAEEEGQRRPQPGPQPREQRDARERGGRRDGAGKRVLVEAEAGAAMPEGVVERVHDAEQHGAGEDQRFARATAAHGSRALSKKPTTRCSYSTGRASMPPMCPASGISQSVFGSCAAA